ncbi:MAG: tetratricopeptide repeat protein [Calditrichaeota bacterium]|nr:tetratricopeptide repeat protein [Calditrichota bacterium]
MPNQPKYYSQQSVKLKKLLPVQPLVFARLAECYLQLGRIKPAAVLLTQGLNQNPDYAAGWIIKGCLHLQLKQDRLARAAFERALQIDPTILSARMQCCELAQKEDDEQGYLDHLRILAEANALDANLQTMLQTALLRKAAIDSGAFTPVEVKRMMPSTLRQELLKRGLLPPEIKRRIERPTLPSSELATSTAPISAPAVKEPPRLAWEGMKYEEEEIGFRARPEELKTDEAQPEEAESDENRIVRVSWADAVSGTAASPLVEISDEQYTSSKEETMAVDEEFIEPDEPAEASAELAPEPENWAERLARRAEKVDAPRATAPKPSDIVREVKNIVGIDSEPKKEIGVAPPKSMAYQDEYLPPLRPLEPLKPLEAAVAETSSEAPVEIPIESTAVDEDLFPFVKPAEASRIPRDETPILRLMKMKKEEAADLVPDRPVESLESVELPSLGAEALDISQIEKDFTAESLETPLVRPQPPLLETPLEMISGEAPVPEAAAAVERIKPKRIVLEKPLEMISGEDAIPKKVEQVKPKRIALETPVEMIAGEAPITEERIKPKRIVLETPLDMLSGETTSQIQTPAEPSPAIRSPVELVSAIEPQAESIPALEEAALEEPPLKIPSEIVAREEDARRRLAIIAQEVTQKKPTLTMPPTLAMKTAASAEVNDAKSKPKIATKTLAELYASQGDWARAIEVYDALLEKFPTNEAYRKRREALQVKLESGVK